MKWLIERIGWNALRSVDVITPNLQCFPETYSGTDEDIERIFTRVCGWMQVSLADVELALFQNRKDRPQFDDNRSQALGLFERRTDPAGRHTIWIDQAQAADPMHLVATIAHELAHCTLLGENWLTVQEADHEFVTDLLPVVRGLGIFLANATIRESSYSDAYIHLWRASRQGYLPARMFGYALALFAWLRPEHKPDWGRHLRKDARGVFDQSLKFLQKTEDAGGLSAPGRDGEEPARPHSLLALLADSKPGARLEALWRLRCPDPPALSVDEWTTVIDGLDHEDRIVRCETACTLAVLNRREVELAERLLQTLRKHHDDDELCAAVALALGSQREPLDLLIDELGALLGHPSSSVAIAALVTLKNYDREASRAVLPSLMERFHKALLSCDSLLIGHAVDTLRAVCVSPNQEAARFFATDADVCRQAQAALSMQIDERALTPIGLPTSASLPVPIPGWRPSEMHDPQPADPDNP